jgi:hypothetical protein
MKNTKIVYYFLLTLILNSLGYSCSSATTTGGWVDCPAGKYCEAGTATGYETACPAGTFSPLTKLTSASECYTCPAGSYCQGVGNTAISGDCEAGYYCPQGSSNGQMNACPAGTYSAATGLSDATQCTTCPAGFYCPSASTAPTTCGEGYYRISTGGTQFSDCTVCSAGYYCGVNATLESECGIGSYSDVGASSCLPCESGYYCSSKTTSKTNMENNGATWDNSGDTEGKCFPGVLCGSGMSRAPTMLQDACPAGFYCPAGATYAVPCPAGTYNPSVGIYHVDNCTDSPAGFYTTLNSTAVVGQCEPGFYCPVGSSSPTQVPCPARYYRQEYGAGSAEDCSLCIAGGYCAGGNVVPAVCTAGSYCPTGIHAPIGCSIGTYSAQTGLSGVEQCTSCAGGSYCDQIGLTTPRGLCEAGFYCVSGANSSRPAYTSNFSENSVFSSSGQCPRGHYCPEGTTYPQVCPEGTYNPNWGSTSNAACIACTSGHYCAGEANIDTDGQCLAGYYCPEGSSTTTALWANAGYYAPTGSAAALQCAQGKYQANSKQSSCDDCPMGYYCPNSNMSTYTNHICPVGHYCPLGTVAPIDCDVGYFNDVQGVQAQEDCKPCTPGSYCDTAGISVVSGPCMAGYYCSGQPYGNSDGGADHANPVGQLFGDRCPEGYYCPQGSSQPVACPKGTYMNETTATGTFLYRFILIAIAKLTLTLTFTTGEMYYKSRQVFCHLCSASYACASTAMTLSDGTGFCEPGYWCGIGAPGM